MSPYLKYFHLFILEKKKNARLVTPYTVLRRENAFGPYIGFRLARWRLSRLSLSYGPVRTNRFTLSRLSRD